MPRPTTLAVHRSVAPLSWRSPTLPLALGAVATSVLAGGIALIVLRIGAATREFVLLPAGLALLACSFVQWRAAWAAWHRGGGWWASLRNFDATYCRRACIGAIGLYLIAMAIGPAPYIAVGLAAAIVGWLTVLSFTATPGQWERWLAWSRQRTARRAEYLVLGALLLPVAAELSLQGVKAAKAVKWSAAGNTSPTSTAEALVPLSHDSLARHSVAPLPAGPLRVALLDAEPGDSEGRGFESHLERTLPGVQLVPVDLNVPWSSAAPDELAEQLATQRVDLVLALLPVCGELTRERPAPSWFDWRQFELARLAGLRSDVAPQSPPATAHDYESFCGNLSPQLAACRTPIDDRMRQRWQETFACVDALSAACSARELPLAMVLVPGEFQLNHALRDTLARRAGYATEQIDVELPQRKLAGYAAERRLPLVDLLPSLRVCRDSPFARHAEEFSEAGHRATAAALSGWLESRYGSQLAATSQLTSSP